MMTMNNSSISEYIRTLVLVLNLLRRISSATNDNSWGSTVSGLTEIAEAHNEHLTHMQVENALKELQAMGYIHVRISGEHNNPLYVCDVSENLSIRFWHPLATFWDENNCVHSGLVSQALVEPSTLKQQFVTLLPDFDARSGALPYTQQELEDLANTNYEKFVDTPFEKMLDFYQAADEYMDIRLGKSKQKTLDVAEQEVDKKEKAVEKLSSEYIGDIWVILQHPETIQTISKKL